MYLYTWLSSLLLSHIYGGERAEYVTVQLGRHSYVNKGPVAFGILPSNAVDSLGDTIRGIGSAVTVKRGSWFLTRNGSFAGIFITHPDSGPHGNMKDGYQTRQHEIDFVLNPYEGSKNLDYSEALKTLTLSYQRTVLQFDTDDSKLSGVDPTGTRPPTSSDPALPLVSSADPRLTLDTESIVEDVDGTYWLGDEYGPHIYNFNSSGHRIGVIQPPRAYVPLNSAGNIEFISDANPVTGRMEGQGFEGLTMDYETRTLYAMLQSALVQDGGADKDGKKSDTTSRYTRIIAYGVGGESPELKGEWVVPLPRSASKGKTRASSEILFVGDGTFLSLSRDGDGRGGNGEKSSYKQIDLFSVNGATSIAGSKYDDPSNPVAAGGNLEGDVVPAEYTSFVDMIDKKSLKKLGLHNGSPDDETLIASRWEGLAIAPVCDAENQDDYFVFAIADNNFSTTDGIIGGVPYNEGLDVHSQSLVYRLTLPSLARGSVGDMLVPANLRAWEACARDLMSASINLEDEVAKGSSANPFKEPYPPTPSTFTRSRNNRAGNRQKKESFDDRLQVEEPFACLERPPALHWLYLCNQRNEELDIPGVKVLPGNIKSAAGHAEGTVHHGERAVFRT
ncbi:esterase-like activity of phytase-domain-containing protein [Ephemerocybe angulata]|uniref:Esterase-like activity of phytase-domain-containing protein n=1 Tax=Ephemerocybe angulata TaxID=980116 RepID=A0A8H6I6G9_9AGAR|nr:esterase-like activity of phytase-domain-containing protein [Tulosesus angulatus]